MNTLVIFDYDKTMADAFEIQRKGSKAIFDHFSLNGDMTLVDYDGSNHYAITRDCLNHIGQKSSEEDVANGLKRWITRVQELASPGKIEVYSGVRELLGSIQKNGYLGLVTGNSAALGPALLEGANLTSFFNEDVCVFAEGFGEEGRVGGIVQCIMQCEGVYNVSFGRVVYVGDSPKDVIAGNYLKVHSFILDKGIAAFSAAVSHAEGRKFEDIQDADFAYRDLKDYERVARELLDR